MNNLFISQLKPKSSKIIAWITYSSFPESSPYITAARMQHSCSRDAKAYIQLLAQRSSQQGSAPWTCVPDLSCTHES